MPIELTPAGMLPGRYLHLMRALNRLQGKGIITLITSQQPHRWALTTPGDFPDAEGAGE